MKNVFIASWKWTEDKVIGVAIEDHELKQIKWNKEENKKQVKEDRIGIVRFLRLFFLFYFHKWEINKRFIYTIVYMAFFLRPLNNLCNEYCVCVCMYVFLDHSNSLR